MITMQSLCEESLFLYKLTPAKAILQLGYSYFDNRLSFKAKSFVAWYMLFRCEFEYKYNFSNLVCVV